MLRRAHYDIGTYSGTISINCSEDDDDEAIIAKARRLLRQHSGAPLPFGAERWRVLSDDERAER